MAVEHVAPPPFIVSRQREEHEVACRRWLESLLDWVAEPQMVEKLTVVGSYRLF